MTSARLPIDWITTIVVRGDCDSGLRSAVTRACVDFQMHALGEQEAFFPFDQDIAVIAQDDILAVGLKVRQADTLVVIGPADPMRCYLLRNPIGNAPEIVETYGVAPSTFSGLHAEIAEVVHGRIATTLIGKPVASDEATQRYQHIAPLLAFGWVADLSAVDRDALLVELVGQGLGRVVVPYVTAGGRVLFVDPRDESLAYARSGYHHLAETLAQDGFGASGVRAIPRDERTFDFFRDANEVEVLSGSPALVVTQAEYQAVRQPRQVPAMPGASVR